MRLISKFHDFYDGVARNTVHDKTHTFVRKQKEIEGVETYLLSYMDYETRTEAITISGEIIGFCGEIYPCIRIAITEIKNYMKETSVTHLYNWDDVASFLPFEEMRKTRSGSRIYYYGSVKSDQDLIKKWLESGKGKEHWFSKDIYEAKKDPALKKLFLDQRIAYFRIYRPTIRGKLTTESYPILQDVSFFKVFDAYTCFQKIEHFLVNEIVRPDEIKQEIQDSITDDLKAHSHGYDKWSFRKEPTKKKRK